MPSIINGLFAGRSGISSHGTAIAVVGDNISNSSTIGFKASRAEFQDLIAGGQAAGKVVGSGSSTSAVSTIFEQGTLEFSGRTLDLAIDGNGLFVLDNNGSRYYTRAGNFTVDSSGYIVNPNGLRVLGFPEGGSGTLEPISINTVSQDSVGTSTITVAGNLNAASDILTNGAADIPTVPAAGTAPVATDPTYTELNAAAEFSTVVDAFDAQGAKHTMTFFFFHTAANTYVVRGYVNSEDVSASTALSGYPRLIGSSVTMTFSGNGSRSNPPTTVDLDDITIPWTTGASSSTLDITFEDFTQYAAPSNILSITQDGKGIGTVGNITIDKDGSIFAQLDNGQAAVIGTIGLVNFSNPEGLIRLGNNLLQQSPSSGEPVIGRPDTGSFGAVSSGSLELSTVDIASEFVKLITLQRGFQANSRIITTINQLLSEIIQLV